MTIIRAVGGFEIPGIYHGDASDLLKEVDKDSIDLVVTSPPYWGQRSYGDDDREIGCERTYQEYVSKMTSILDELYRVVKNRGSMWLNVGDVYATWAGSTGNRNHGREDNALFPSREALRPDNQPNRFPQEGLRPGCLVGIPWRLAFAAIDVGWTLRSEVIWEKPNCRPESAVDRPTRSHEHLFLLTKGRRYTFNESHLMERGVELNKRKGRSIWRIPNLARSVGHPAAMPEKLAEQCILASSHDDDLVLDPFSGSGTTCRVAASLERWWLGFELQEKSVELSQRRTTMVQKGFSLW